MNFDWRKRTARTFLRAAGVPDVCPQWIEKWAVWAVNHLPTHDGSITVVMFLKALWEETEVAPALIAAATVGAVDLVNDLLKERP